MFCTVNNSLNPGFSLSCFTNSNAFPVGPVFILLMLLEFSNHRYGQPC